MAEYSGFVMGTQRCVYSRMAMEASRLVLEQDSSSPKTRVTIKLSSFMTMGKMKASSHERV
jgi:hypothetical protein